MPDERKELLRRFYLTLELMCTQADRATGRHAAQRIGDLYDDEDEAAGLGETVSTAPSWPPC
jgi:hypothetical protein